MEEEIIVTLTTWEPRINNLPIVLDSIYNQSITPNKVIINFSNNEFIPPKIEEYINKHKIEVNYVEDTKVYKKLIPTLKKYPNACIINIDDDCIYPDYMIEDYINIHKKYPNNPISGNREVKFGMQCHCGNSSLTKAEYFGDWLKYIDKEVIKNCASDDIVMTYFANKNNRPYLRTSNLYFTNIISTDLTVQPYSKEHADGIELSMKYLTKRFGKVDTNINNYINNNTITNIINDIIKNKINDEQEIIYKNFSFKLGKFITAPFRWIKKIITK